MSSGEAPEDLEDEIQFYKSANLPKVEAGKLIMPQYVQREMKEGLSNVRANNYNVPTGSRSAQFDFLLQMENPTPKHMLEGQERTRDPDNFKDFVRDLSGGEKQ